MDKWVSIMRSHSVMSLCDAMDCSPPGSSVHGIFASKNTGVGCHFLLQEKTLAIIKQFSVLKYTWVEGFSNYWAKYTYFTSVSANAIYIFCTLSSSLYPKCKVPNYSSWSLSHGLNRYVSLTQCNFFSSGPLCIFCNCKIYVK